MHVFLFILLQKLNDPSQSSFLEWTVYEEGGDRDRIVTLKALFLTGHYKEKKNAKKQ